MFPYPILQDEQSRLAAVRDTHLPDGNSAPLFDAIVSLAAKQFGCPIALVTLLDENRQWFKAKVGLEVCQTERDIAFCNHTILTSDILVVEDASKDERFRNNPLVSGALHLRFYAGYPLSVDGVHRLGSLCIIDHSPRSFSHSDEEMLAEYGRLVEALIRSHIQVLEMGTAIQQARVESRELELKNSVLAQSERMAGIGAWALDLNEGLLSWSDQVFAMYDVDKRTQPTLQQALAFFGDSERVDIELRLERSIATGTPFEFEGDIVSATGRVRRIRSTGQVEIAHDRPSRLIGIIQDITEVHDAQAKLWNAANIDGLTGIANRRLFQHELSETLTKASAAGSPVSLLLMDLDRFKEINDTLGHQAGDDVLRSVARRLAYRAPSGSTVARLGGDEFAILVPGLGSPSRQRALARQLSFAISEPIRTMGENLVVTATIGIANYPADGQTADALLRCADIALYNGKRLERGAVGFYAADVVNVFDRRRLAIENVERAIIGNRLIPFYQPIVRLSDRTIYGYEALARIRNLDGTISAAGDFAEAFSDPRSCRRIGDRMLRLVTADIANMRAGAINPGVVSLNASQADLYLADFPERLLRRLEECSIDPVTIKLEVTETLFLGHDTKAIMKNLQHLSDAGILIALDDFGTGFSSLTHLRDFPIHQIKIDRSFVSGLGRDAESPAIIKALVDLAHTLEMTVIAEGIETEGQYDFLKAIGCDSGQGYLFGHALDVSSITGWRKEPHPLGTERGSNG